MNINFFCMSYFFSQNLLYINITTNNEIFLRNNIFPFFEI